MKIMPRSMAAFIVSIRRGEVSLKGFVAKGSELAAKIRGAVQNFAIFAPKAW
jgi:hypothetical protein